MRRRGVLSVVLSVCVAVLAVWIAVPAVALGAVVRPGEVSALGDPVVHVSPDRVAGFRSCWGRALTRRRA
jgi:hypothetical protein